MISLKSARSKRENGPRDLGRSEIRSLLKRSGPRNACTFTQAVVCYLDFLSEYYYLLGYTDETERLSQVQSTLVDCWKFAPYIRRVSDLERFLCILLEKKPFNPAHEFAPPHENLAQLNHSQRYLLVARTYQNWTYKALHLSTRIKRHEIPSSLTDLKCALIGFDRVPLKTSQQILLYLVNDLLEGELKTREVRTIEKELTEQPLLRQFKADWLLYRCELAELKQRAFFDPATVYSFKQRLTEALQQIPVKQPNFRDNLINQFSFNRLPSI